MKKIALVAAVAASVAAPAFAQGSVTLWGRLNTSVESQKNGNNDRVVVEQNNGSRLGFRGVEDLGGGLKAGFNLEHGLNSDTGAASGGTTFWSRESDVWIGGAFGTVRLGSNFPDSYFATVDRTSNHNHDTGTSSDALFSTIGFSYATNKVTYITPNISGFDASISAMAGEGTRGRAFDSSFNYSVGTLHIGGGYTQADRFGVSPKRQAYVLEADYGFGPFLVTGYVSTEKVDGFRSRNIARVSGMYSMGASEFHLNVGGTKSGADGTFRNAGASQWTLGYNYNLSKRTKVYAFYTAIDQKLPNHAGDFNSLAAGVRHNF
ncbi:porin [Pelomonas sp. KK5]|uniref:porin n=1 Tax=Pelomonas sp. KK5 TaxID=1855730 RepID=UPI00097BC427|nr:porin [Pelomonas sp. KK5]